MPDKARSTLEVEIFRTGDYGGKGRYDEAALDAIASDYNADLHEAPVTIDHTQSGPAQGWVQGLRRIGDRLVAILGRISPSLQQLLADGGYKKRSVELYRAFRETGRPYLKAVSFLGAAAPEVKGLADPVFQDEGMETVLFTETTETFDAAEDAQNRLVEAGRWRPAWEDAGLMDVFRQAGPGELLEGIVAVLMTEAGPVQFGETERRSNPGDDATVGFNGTPSPDSIARHRKALAFMAENPTHSYAEALVRSAGE
ncbi:hypothetical protein KQI84_08340 [bacterium]|nr:hypothetical protein [bacterium]